MMDVVNASGSPERLETGQSRTPMPSLFRFLGVIAIIGGVVYGAVYALANFVKPTPREMTINISPDKFQKK